MRFLPQASLRSGISPNVTRLRGAIALLVAVVSDLAAFVLSFTLFLQIGADVVTAFLLWALLGWRWGLLVALILEALPMVSVFPAWTLVVLVLLGAGMYQKKT